MTSTPGPSARTLRSRHSELRVLALLSARGWTELVHDVECAHVQIDLIGRAPSGTLTLIEVKMQTAWGMARVTRLQLGRLSAAARVLSECEPVQLALALVEDGRVRLLPLDGVR